MQQRQVGTSGLQVSAVGLGCNNFGGRIDLEATRLVVDKALDLGITLLDTADSYGNRGGSESFLGECLGKRRNDIVLASKVGWAMDDAGHLKGGSRRYVMSAVEASLRRLKTDWIDLYQFHITDPATPIEETLRAFDDLVRVGKVRYIGWSNVPAWQLTDAAWISRSNGLHRFVSVQAEYSLIERQAAHELIPAADYLGIGLLPFFPLAGGMLTGKYQKDAAMPEGARLTNTPKLAERYMTQANWARVEKLEAFCTGRGKSLLDLAFAWLLSHRVVSSVIAGATKPEQVEANVTAGGWQLSDEECQEVEAILDNRSGK
jgi:aryl-alcohol dehydrogenase-like predicted oxidoreductase